MVKINEIRACMARNQITQKQLAQELHISEKTMTEKMKTGNFGLEEAKLMIELLDIKIPSEIFLLIK